MERKNNFFVFVKVLLLGFVFFSGTAVAQSARPIVTNINAYGSSSTKITVTWNLPQKTEGSTIRSLVVYRSPRPLIDVSSFAKLTPIATLPMGSVSYTDLVPDKREYYYAVLTITAPGTYETDSELYYDEELDALPSTDESGTTYTVLLPGVNATVKGTKVKTRSQKNSNLPEQVPEQKDREYSKNQLRDQPLPFIDVLGDGEEIHVSQISPEAHRKALELIGKKNGDSAKKKRLAQALLEPYVFEDDLMSPPGGDEYLLFEVLRTSFIQKKYSDSISALTKFLGQNRSLSVSNRAHFYLGESYYFSGMYPEALSEFLLVEEAYSALSRKWIESTLTLYQIP